MNKTYQFYFKNNLKEYSIKIYENASYNYFIFKYKGIVSLGSTMRHNYIGGILRPVKKIA